MIPLNSWIFLYSLWIEDIPQCNMLFFTSIIWLSAACPLCLLLRSTTSWVKHKPMNWGSSLGKRSHCFVCWYPPKTASLCYKTSRQVAKYIVEVLSKLFCNQRVNRFCPVMVSKGLLDPVQKNWRLDCLIQPAHNPCINTDDITISINLEFVKFCDMWIVCPFFKKRHLTILYNRYC